MGDTLAWATGPRGRGVNGRRLAGMPHSGRLGGVRSCLGADTPMSCIRRDGSDMFAVRALDVDGAATVRVVVASDGAWVPLLAGAVAEPRVDDLLDHDDLLGVAAEATSADSMSKRSWLVLHGSA